MWTDVFQTIVMFVGLLASVIQGRHSARRCRIEAFVSSGVIDAGGAQAVWQRAVDGGRVEFFKYVSKCVQESPRNLIFIQF